MSYKIKNSIYMGLICSLIGLAVGLHISITNNESYNYFFIYSTISAFLSPFILWYLIIERTDKLSLNRSVFIGLFGALVGHYLTFLLQMWFLRILFLITGTRLTSLEDPAGFIDAIWGAAVIMIYSLILYGWITIPLGGIIGYFYGRYRIKLYYSTQKSPNLNRYQSS